MKILIVFHSLYGHIYRMAKEMEKAVLEIENAEVFLRRVPETLSDEILTKMGAIEFQKTLSEVPICTIDDLQNANGILFGTPTRFGNMTGEMRQFLDSTGGLWASGALIGKIGSVFTSSATQHGGQESTILNFHTFLLHHGMLITGLPYSYQAQMIVDEVIGCSPYGASTITGGDGSRMPSEIELQGARFQAHHLTRIAQKLIS